MYHCLDPADLLIQGNEDTMEGQIIYIDVIKCQDKKDCKSDEEIKAYFGEKYMYILKNQIFFDCNKFDEDSIIKESRLDSIRFG